MKPVSAKRRERIEAFRCPAGHCFLNRYPRCPACGDRLTALTIASTARLLTHTIVRVNPTGRPIALGIARTDCGAATLCIIVGGVRGTGRERVQLFKRKDRFYALGRGSRINADLP
jgi:uncharacterized OB-fold protein